MEIQNKKQVNINLLLCAIIALAMVFFWFKSCQSETTTTTITVPEVKGKFEAVKPLHTSLSITDKSKIDKSENAKKPVGQNLSKKEIEFLQAEINKLLAETQKLENDFIKANDSLKQIIYNQAIQLKTYNQTFDDEYITATASGIVRGELQSLKLDYTIKAKKQEVKIKQTVFRLLAGIEIANSKTLDNFSTKANIMFQNQKGNILSVGVDTDQRFYLGYNFSILNIKK